MRALRRVVPAHPVAAHAGVHASRLREAAHARRVEPVARSLGLELGEEAADAHSRDGGGPGAAREAPDGHFAEALAPRGGVGQTCQHLGEVQDLGPDGRFQIPRAREALGPHQGPRPVEERVGGDLGRSQASA
mgnify:CR=1 FL=1